MLTNVSLFRLVAIFAGILDLVSCYCSGPLNVKVSVVCAVNEQVLSG